MQVKYVIILTRYLSVRDVLKVEKQLNYSFVSFCRKFLASGNERLGTCCSWRVPAIDSDAIK